MKECRLLFVVVLFLSLSCHVAAASTTAACPDADGDHYADCTTSSCTPTMTCGDCRDDWPAVHPGAPEACNHIDDNCDGFVDNGAPKLDAFRRVALTTTGPQAYFGQSVAPLGDVDRDGVIDFAVGASRDTTPVSSIGGRAYVVSGRTRAVLCSAYDALGGDNFYFGAAVAGLGDVDGDGTPDFAVGSYWSQVPWGYYSGSVELLSGRDCSLIRRLSDPAGAVDDQFGYSIAALGDVTGDGTSEIVIGANKDDTSAGADAGSVLVFNGATGAFLYRSVDPAPAASVFFGESVVALGDVTGDGKPDFAVGAIAANTPTTWNQGKVVVFSGANGAYVKTLYDGTYPGHYGYFGKSLTKLPDVNGDGLPELVVGEPGFGTSYLSSGSAVLVSIGSGAVLRRFSYSGSRSYDNLGSSVAAIADIDGDGTRDIAIGAPGADVDSTDNGMVVLFSTASGNSVAVLTDHEAGKYQAFGTSVCDGGNIAGDGSPAVVVGAPNKDSLEQSAAGDVYLFVRQADCDGDGVTPFAGDCDDSNALVHPGQTESCNGVDDNCDGRVDEDADGDGYAACGDCANGNASIHPGAIERCNGKDDDCDGSIDEGPDADHDGFTTPCDTNDADPSVHPGALEACNQKDDDSNGVVDDGWPVVVAERTALGPSVGTNPHFGKTLCPAGDLDGDGVPDLAIDAPDDDWYGHVGKVLLVSGANLATLRTCFDPDGGYYDHFGASIVDLGDVSGDGIDDFAAGAPDHSPVGTVVIFSGADCSVIRRLSSTHDTGAFGAGLAVVPDADGDGTNDLLVGAPGQTTAQGTFRGGVSLRSTATGEELRSFEDPNGGSGDDFGRTVGVVGDADGDGRSDYGIGAPMDWTAHSRAGSLSILSSSSGNLIRKIVDPLGGDTYQFGVSFTSISDIDGDGVRDIAVGSRAWSPGNEYYGAVLVISSRTGQILSRILDPERTWDDFFGTALAELPDMNGNGTPELLIGEENDDPNGVTDAGSVLIMDAGTGALLRRISRRSPAESEHLGRSVAVLGDIDGDGRPEIVAGVPDMTSPEMAGPGMIVRFSLGSDCDGDGFSAFGGDCDDTAAWRNPGAAEVCNTVDDNCDGRIDEDQDGDGYGVCVDCSDHNPRIHPDAKELCNGVDDDCDGSIDDGPDADGDGVTSPCDCNDASAAVHPGAVDVCNHVDDDCVGGIDPVEARLAESRKITDARGLARDRFAWAVASVGDVTGDGLSDYAVGSPYADERGLADSGRVTVFSGADNGVVCRVARSAPAAGDLFGYSVAGLGDLDGDGVPDIAVGAPYATTSAASAGAVVLVSGRTCAPFRELLDPTAVASARFGRSIAGIGDVDGDAVRDILVGESAGTANNVTLAGLVVAFSGASGHVLYRASDPNGGYADGLGSTLAALPDLDDDGIPDFSSGSPFDDYGVSNSGSVLVFSGRSGRFLRKIVDPNRRPDDRLGNALDAVPDMDGDGYPELVSGLTQSDAGYYHAGAAVIFSARSGAVLARLTDPEGQYQDYLGQAVTALGDLNGDGISEIAVSACYDDIGGVTNAGSVLVFDGKTGSVLWRLSDPERGTNDYLGYTMAALRPPAGATVRLIASSYLDDVGSLLDAGSLTVFTIESDCDRDGAGPSAGDCADDDATVWSAPSPVADLRFAADRMTLTWSAPLNPGSYDPPRYDTLRATGGDLLHANCLEAGDLDTTARDGTVPSPGTVFSYFVRASNRCGAGVESDTEGRTIRSRSCP